jgi:sterol desaturase/sphingolipid hydroxylase (fatty acid hydroxylase superfamily)
MPMNFFPPPNVVGAILATLALWFLEMRFAYWPLPSNRLTHARNNFVLGICSLLLLGAAAFASITLSLFAREQGWGILNWLRLPLFFETVVGAVLYDLGNYWIHRSQHQVPALWRLHRAHHTDRYIDVSSAFRFHPFESLYRGVCFVALVFVGGISIYSILLYACLVSIALPLSHANLNIPASWESWCRYGLVLPLHHRIHHSVKRAEHDRNYGIVFLWWDFCFGTYLDPSNVTDLRIGLEYVSEKQGTELAAILKEPFVSPTASAPSEDSPR